MNLLYAKFSFVFKNWANLPCFPKTSKLRLLNKSLLLLFFMVAWGTNVLAQPSQITPVSDEKCAGMIRFKFLAGQEISGTFNDIERNIDNSKLMIQFDGETANEIMFFDAENCTPESFSLPLEGVDVTLDGCKRDAPHGIELKNARTRISGDDRLVEIELHGLGPIRSQKGFDIWLEYQWYEDNEDLLESDETGKKRYEKHEYINTIFTTAFRDDCNPNEVKVTANAKVACNESGFKYRVTIQKSTNSDLSSPTTLVDNKTYNAGSAGSSVITEITETTAGQIYYRSIIEYLDGSNNPYQKDTSVITSVQQFSVAPPTMSAVGSDQCDNKINVKWQYNASEADRFNIYRSLVTKNTLAFDGENDCLIVQNGGNMVTSADITLEARVKLNDLNNNNIFYNEGNFDIFTNGNGQLVVKMAGVSRDTVFEALPLNSWIHVAVVYDHTSFLKVYLNGNLVLETNKYIGNSLSSNSDVIFFGCWNTSYHLNGELSDIRIWDKPLTTIDPDLITTGTEDGLKLYYDFSEGQPEGDNSAVTVVENRSNNDFDAQINNFALTGTTSNYSSNFSNHQKIGEVNGQTFEYEDDENINSNQPYEYYITAIKTCNNNTEESLPSNSISGLSPTTPMAPTDLALMIAQNQVFYSISDMGKSWGLQL